MVDFFPTLIELAGLPTLPTCQGVDKPPTVQCLQGISYAEEFSDVSRSAGALVDRHDGSAADNGTDNVNVVVIEGDNSKDTHDTAGEADTAKKYAFSQWPQPPGNPSSGVPFYRMAYSVRAATGFRLTEYVPYTLHNFSGVWSNTSVDKEKKGQEDNDLELYDYNSDPYETTNLARNETYTQTVLLLKQALRRQFEKTPHN